MHNVLRSRLKMTRNKCQKWIFFYDVKRRQNGHARIEIRGHNCINITEITRGEFVVDMDTIFSLCCVHGESNYSSTRIPNVSGYFVRKDASVLHAKAGNR